METIRTPQQVREGLNNKTFSLPIGRTAVIATMPFSDTQCDLGVQFWDAETLKKGEKVNSDGTISKFVEFYEKVESKIPFNTEMMLPIMNIMASLPDFNYDSYGKNYFNSDKHKATCKKNKKNRKKRNKKR